MTLGSMALVLAVLLPLVRGQVPHWGPCPEPITQADFSIKQVPPPPPVKPMKDLFEMEQALSINNEQMAVESLFLCCMVKICISAIFY